MVLLKCRKNKPTMTMHGHIFGEKIEKLCRHVKCLENKLIRIIRICTIYINEINVFEAHRKNFIVTTSISNL